MDRSRLMGLATFVPLTGLLQGHGHKKKITTILYVSLNMNNVLSCNQQLKQGSFFCLRIDLVLSATLPLIYILSSFLKLFST